MDSYGKHGFPEILQDRLLTNRAFSDPIIDARGGRELDLDLTFEIKTDMTLNANIGIPQVHFLIIGSNNIRRKEDPEMVSFFRAIAEHGSGLDNCHVFIGGLIPSLRTDKESMERFQIYSRQLRALSRSFSKVSYVGFQKFFTTEGSINDGYYKPDKIHLNELGVQLLTEAIVTALGSVRKSFLKN